MSIISDLRTSHQRLVVPLAQSYAALGWGVVVLHGIREDGSCTCRKGTDCPGPAKHPRLKDWPSHATTDEEVIGELWERWPDANLGIRLGPASGICDVEYDDDIGRQTAEQLLGDCQTPTFRSNRSTHRLFRFPDDLLISKSVVKTEGLELRFGTAARGAQSVFPPSVHAAGVPYKWADGLSPDYVEPQLFPETLVRLMRVYADQPELSPTEFVYEGDLSSHPGSPEGERYDTACRLVGAHLAEHGPNADLLPQAFAWAERCTPPFPAKEIEKIVGGLVQKDLAKQRTTAAAIPSPKRDFEVIAHPFSEIEPEPINWLWPERIALGKLSLLVGQPGQGKTFAAVDMLARVSRGSQFADGSPCALGEAAILTAEDGAGDTIRPRLDAAGADVTKVLHIEGIRAPDGKAVHLSLGAHLGQLDVWLTTRPAARLIVIDPITAFLGNVDSHENAAVRGILGPIAKLAEKHRVAILGISHLSKRDTKAMNRIIGSIAFVAAARAAWLVAPDPDDGSGDRRLLLPVKNNLARSTGLAFAIEEGRVVWETAPVLISADDIDHDGGKRPGPPKSGADEWLAEVLRQHPAGRIATEIIAEGVQQGFSRATIYRAANEIGAIKAGGTWTRPEEDSTQSYRF